MNKVRILLIITGLFIGWNCVGPPDSDHWLVNNYPGVVNTESLFKFEVKGDNFSLDKNYSLNMIFSSDNELLTNLRVYDYGGSTQDTSSILLINWDGEAQINDINGDGDSTDTVFEFIDTDSSGSWTTPETLLIDYNGDNDSTDVLLEFVDSNGNNIWDSGSVYPNDPILISGNLNQESENNINPIEYYPESVSIKLDKFTGVIEFILIKSTVE